MWNMETLRLIILMILSGNQFYINEHCDLDLWPTEPKINGDHVLIETNHHVKYEDSVINGSQDWAETKCDGGRTDRAKKVGET